jgi:hypothetical protein
METAPSRRVLTLPSHRDTGSVLTAVEEKILSAVYRLPYLRIEQVTTCLGWSPASKKEVQKIIRSLIERNYLDVQPLPRLTSKGSLPHLYMLGTQGITFYQDKGFPVSYHSPKERLRSYGHLVHAQWVSEVLLAAYQLERLEPAISLPSFLHDLRIKLTPCKVLVDEKAVTLNPDASLDWYLTPPYGKPGADGFSCFLEVDDDEEDKNQLTPKVAKYVSFCEGSVIANPFGFDMVNHIVFVITTGGTRRVNQVRTWIAKELERLGKTHLAPLFQVAHVPLPPRTLDPSFFLTSHFFPLLSDTPTALLEKML